SGIAPLAFRAWSATLGRKGPDAGGTRAAIRGPRVQSRDVARDVLTTIARLCARTGSAPVRPSNEGGGPGGLVYAMGRRDVRAGAHALGDGQTSLRRVEGR